MKNLRKLFFRLFKTYNRLELVFVTYKEAEVMLRQNQFKPESEQWYLAREEDMNFDYGMVYLERRERVWE